jgi:hypothetical protein
MKSGYPSILTAYHRLHVPNYWPWVASHLRIQMILFEFSRSPIISFWPTAAAMMPTPAPPAGLATRRVACSCGLPSLQNDDEKSRFHAARHRDGATVSGENWHVSRISLAKRASQPTRPADPARLKPAAFSQPATRRPAIARRSTQAGALTPPSFLLNSRRQRSRLHVRGASRHRRHAARVGRADRGRYPRVPRGLQPLRQGRRRVD